MNEKQRMQYVEAMGIDMFVPRYLLSNSRAANQCPLPEGEKSEKLIDSSFFLSEQPQRHNKRSSVKPVVRDNEIETVSEQAIQFSLSIWRASDHLLVIDSRQSGQALPDQLLLTNILVSQNLLPASLPPVEIIHWPIVESRTQHQGWKAARDMVGNFLEGRILPKPVKFIYLMGEDAFNAVLGEKQNYLECLWQNIPLDAFAAEAIVLPSLFELLTQPALKKAVWLSLLKLED